MVSDFHIAAINKGQRQVILNDGSICPMASLHESDGEEVDDMEFAVFATVQLPDGTWTPVMFDEYGDKYNG